MQLQDVMSSSNMIITSVFMLSITQLRTLLIPRMVDGIGIVSKPKYLYDSTSLSGTTRMLLSITLCVVIV